MPVFLSCSSCGLRPFCEKLIAILLSDGTNIDNINKNGARTAGAKVAPFLFILSKFWVLESRFAIILVIKNSIVLFKVIRPKETKAEFYFGGLE